MRIQQPAWKLFANLGDVNPLDYGGLFVYVDETGVYCPEMERLEVLDSETDSDIPEGETHWEVRRILLENLDAESVTREWFYDSLTDVASYINCTKDAIVADLISADPAKRAFAWRAILDYHGWDNGDSYPVVLTDASEVERRYA